MKLRLTLTAAEALALMLCVYFEPSHCVRGWLLGEACFEGRPTSYWRGRIEVWANLFESEEFAVAEIYGPDSRDADAFYIRIRYRSPKERFLDRFRTRNAIDSDYHRPTILNAEPDAEAVLKELEQDPSVRRYAQAARKAGELNRHFGR